MSHLSDTEHKYYTATFLKIDKDKNGYIDIEELGDFCLSFDSSISFANVKRLFKRIDENNDGKIALHEFLAVAPHVTEEDEKEDKKLETIFNNMDQNNDGYLTAQEVSQALCAGGEHVPLHKAQLIVQKMDTNGDGKIDQQELLTYYRLKKMLQKLANTI